MTQTQPYYTMVPESGTITLPPEYRGKAICLNISEQAAPKKTMRDFVAKYTGILENCDIESVEAMKEDRINYILEKYQ